MNIVYEFVTGEKMEIEVSEEIGSLSVEIDRKIYNSNRRETGRHNSFIDMEERGFQFKDNKADCDIEGYIEKIEMKENVRQALLTLPSHHQELIRKVFFENMKIVQIAADERVTEAAIRKRLKRIYKKLKKGLK